MLLRTVGQRNVTESVEVAAPAGTQELGGQGRSFPSKIGEVETQLLDPILRK